MQVVIKEKKGFGKPKTVANIVSGLQKMIDDLRDLVGLKKHQNKALTDSLVKINLQVTNNNTEIEKAKAVIGNIEKLIQPATSK